MDKDTHVDVTDDAAPPSIAAPDATMRRLALMPIDAIAREVNAKADLRAAIARVRAYAVDARHGTVDADIVLVCDAAAERAAGQPVAWMVGDDPDSAATYNRSKRADAYDAARRWNCGITALTTAAGAPEFTPAPASEPRAYPADCGPDSASGLPDPLASAPQAEPQPEAIPIAPVEVVRQALKELLESISECRMDQVTARFAKASVMARAVVDRYKDAT